MDRMTKIIATLGPAVASREKVAELIAAGMDVARLNFSHGTYEMHRDFARWVREVSEEQERAVGLLQDIQGPRIRVGTFPDGEVELEAGQQIKLISGEEMAAPGEIYVDHLESAVGLEPGHRILLADGFVHLEVEDAGGSSVQTRVTQGGVVGDHKGVAFPETPLDLPPVTEKDERDLQFGEEIGVDLIAASFVTSADDVRLIRKLSGGLPIIAKIERTLGYQALDEILEDADGAMVARGDLGVEMSLQRLPMVQKEIITKTNSAGRISITATEMLESMTTTPRPTRAEVTDVANAVLDGTDVVMLSGETAIGRYPVRAVEVMDIVCREVEKSPEVWKQGVDFLRKESPFPSAVAQACVQAADNLGLPVIVAFTESGATARLISKYRPHARIVTFTARPETYRQMSLYWGVTPLNFDRLNSTDDMIFEAERRILERGLAEEGQGVAMVAGVPPNQAARTNLVKLHMLGGEVQGTPGR